MVPKVRTVSTLYDRTQELHTVRAEATALSVRLLAKENLLVLALGRLVLLHGDHR